MADLKISDLSAAAAALGPMQLEVNNAGTSERVTISQIDTLTSATTITLTNKTINLSNNTFTGTTAQFNTALSDGTFVVTSGTPVNNQVGVWTADGILEGDTNLTWSGSILDINGTITPNGINITTPSGGTPYAAERAGNVFNQVQNTSATADEQIYRWGHSGTSFVIQSVNDAATIATTLLSATPAGVTSLLASGSLRFGAITILDDSAGTMTLQNIDAIDATTETTLEAAIDSLTNLVAVGALDAGSITSNFGNIDIGASTFDTTGVVTAGSIQVDNININGNTIISTDTNGNITLTPDGTGNVVLGNFTFDGDQTVGAGQDNFVLTYDNGTGLISLEAATGGGLANVVEDTTPQLGGNLDVNGNSIVSVSAGNIAITPDTTGDIVLDGLNWPQADGTTGQFLQTNGAGQLVFATPSGSGDMLISTYDPAGINEQLVGLTATQTLTNKTFALGSNTLSGTAAQFDTACTDDSFAFISDTLSVFAATTSAQLAGVISDETGSGALVFATSPTLVTPALGTPASGVLTNATGYPGDSSLTTVGTVTTGNVDAVVSASSTTTAGKIEVATAAETNTGTDATRAISPDGFAGSNHGIRYISMEIFAPTTTVATGDGKKFVHIPPGLNGMNLIYVHAQVNTAGITGTTDIQIRRRRPDSPSTFVNADMLSTVITIDSTERGSHDAATPAVIDTANDDAATNDLITVDVDAVSTGTAPLGLIVTLGFQLP